MLDIRLSCSVDSSLNRKINSINVLDVQIRIDLANQLLFWTIFWISNQDVDILGRDTQILECKIRTLNFLDFSRSSIV